MEIRLTDRQIRLLEAIIREYSESSEPVGSKTVVAKYSFKVSPATIRNEMAALLEDGYLEMTHTSSGRVPTSRAFRFFIEQLMHEDELPVLQEIAVKQRLWPQRFEFEKLLRKAVAALAEITGHVALAVTEDGFITSSGSVHILDDSEYWDIEVAKSALKLIDEPNELLKIFSETENSVDVNATVGSEISYSNMSQSALVFSKFSCAGKHGYVSVLGPSRLKYSFVVPAVRYTKNLLEELSSM